MDFGISHLSMNSIPHDLDRPFSAKEFDDIIKHMSNDKSPGPDGFNGLFMKSVGTSSNTIFISSLMTFI